MTLIQILFLDGKIIIEINVLCDVHKVNNISKKNIGEIYAQVSLKLP